MFRTIVAASVITAAALTLAPAAQAGAPQWTFVADTSTSASYIDRASVTEIPGAKSVWVLRNYAVAITLGLDPVTSTPWYPHRSVKVRYAVDCRAGRVAVDAWHMYSGNFANGEIVWADEHHGIPAHSAPAAAEEDAAIDAVCGAKAALRW